MLREINTELDTLEILKRFQGERYPNILESQKDPEKLGRYSFIMADPFLMIKAKGDRITIEERGIQKEITGNPLDILQELMERYRFENDTHLPYIGGAAGYLGYDLCHHVEKLPNTVEDDVDIPDMFFGFYDGVVVVDHLEGKKYIAALGVEGDPGDRIEWVEKKLRDRKVSSEKRLYADKEVEFNCNMTKDYYLDSIQRVKDYIYSGDIYQINFTQRFECELNKSPMELYERLRETNPAPFASYMNFGEGEIVSCSPERFISLRGGVLETRPIKGTIARGKTPEEDRKNKETLINSEKDRSELLMIVDLERNDLGRVSQVGSVEVTELFHIEEYATVFQQVSTVRSKIREDVGLAELLRATFPGGSITGAPKIRAMEVIDELETTSRNLYTGSIGYLGFDGNLDLNIVIRTVVCKGEKAYFQVGGGIVWDSDPESEYEESVLKGRALKEALAWRK